MAPPQPPILLLLSISIATAAVSGQTWMSFYSISCPLAETIVGKTVKSHFKSDPTVAPALLRMHFHDCFVRGCDASILLDGPSAEKTAPANLGVRAFEVIDDAKTQLEKACPGTVSCADIIAIAARDSVFLSNGPWYFVTTGRRDGRDSIAAEVGESLPSPFDSIDVQKKKFKAKGLSTLDLVSLAGAHTIGETSCQLIRNRLYNYTGNGDADPTMNRLFLAQMKSVCPENGDGTKRVALDYGSDDIFDLSFFRNVKNGRGVLDSDQLLWSDASTRQLVQRFLLFGFDLNFGMSMVKMGNVDVKTGNVGEIRNICSRIN